MPVSRARSRCACRGSARTAGGSSPSGSSAIDLAVRSVRKPPRIRCVTEHDEQTRCGVCNQPIDIHGTQLTVTVENRVWDSIEGHFCSWAHVTQWANENEPVFSVEAETAKFGAADVFFIGCLLLVLLFVTLTVIGAVVVVRALF